MEAEVETAEVTEAGWLVAESVSILFTFKVNFDGKIVLENILPVKRGMLVTR